MLLAAGTLAAAATPASGALRDLASRTMLAQAGNAPSLTPTPQRGKTHRRRPPRARPSTPPARPPTQLPYTGGRAWLVFLGGIALLLSGIGLRVRAGRWRRIPRC